MSLLSVQDVGKAFRGYSSEWQRFARWFGIPAKPSGEHWVLRHISFDVQPGESIGIIGQNGAGKSTLLKMITGTLQPTEGRVQIKGRIAAILELGMGFNPDLTGRENAYHGLGLMGYSHADIEKVMPELEAFAEVGEYFDQPIRVYSSGMQMRVAFAVVTVFRPKILIVDEALSVGDSYFQHKSFNRIREFQEQGTTLLIVSHDRSAIQSLCNRAILLENGSVIKDGNPEEIFDFYNAIIAEKENSTVEVTQLDNGRVQTTSGTHDVTINSVSLRNKEGGLVDHVAVGQHVEIHVSVKTHQTIESLVMGYAIKDRLGQMCNGSNTWHTGQLLKDLNKGEEWCYVISFPANLGVGSYSISIALHDGETHLTKNYDWQEMVLVFNVYNDNKPFFQGGVWFPQASISIEKAGSGV